jgi:signal transduction histidine kinase
MLAESRILELAKKGNFGAPPPQLHEVIDELIHSNQLMQHMLNNILYAHKYKQKKLQLDLQPVDLCEVLAEFVSSKALGILLAEKDQKIQVEPVDSIPKVNIDTNEIRRVLTNLVKNASDYSPRYTTITINMKQMKGFLRVEIHDKGTGVAPEIAPHLFHPYATTSAKKFHQIGLGLGLYLSKQIVEAHGGRIGYTSKVGEGSIFYFDLPI